MLLDDEDELRDRAEGMTTGAGEDPPAGDDKDDDAPLPIHLADITDEALIKQFVSRMTGWFELLICDEVHLLKNVDSLMHRAVELLHAEEKVFLLGTPMVNRPIDLLGILRLFWDPGWCDEALRLCA